MQTKNLFYSLAKMNKKAKMQLLGNFIQFSMVIICKQELEENWRILVDIA